MGIIGCCCKVGAFLAVLVAVGIGLLASGALKKTGLFAWIDTFEDVNGTAQFSGMCPAFHEHTPWLFTHDAIPDLTGETHFVTGGNVGLGFWSAQHLAAHNANVVIGCRSEKKCAVAAEKIKEATGKTVETSIIDLSSFKSIRACAERLAASHPTVDGLMLNAGLMVLPFGRTAEGLEMQIGVNHFGHALLTKLVLPQVEAAAATKGVATIVVVSSMAHFSSYPEGIRSSIAAMNDETTYSRGLAYGQSKLANVLFAQELAERTKDANILVNSVHPGLVETNLAAHIYETIASVSQTASDAFKSVVSTFSWQPSDASLTQLFTAVGPELRANKVTGKYFHPIARETKPSFQARNATLQKRLWEMTEDFFASN